MIWFLNREFKISLSLPSGWLQCWYKPCALCVSTRDMGQTKNPQKCPMLPVILSHSYHTYVFWSVHSSDGFSFKSLFDANVWAGVLHQDSNTHATTHTLTPNGITIARCRCSYPENEGAPSIFIYSSWVVQLCFQLIANVSMLTYSQWPG